MMLWSWALTAVGLTCFWLAGRKVWWAWFVGLAGQGLWLAYSLLTQQWGFLAGVAAYSWVYASNAVRWTRERQQATQTPPVGQPPPRISTHRKAPGIMRIFNAAGTRITKGTFPTTPIPAADLPKVVSQDLFETRDYGETDPKPEGSIKTVLFKAGDVLTQRQIDNLFDTAVIEQITPKVGPAAGGTVVTIEGKHLDGVTSVTFGGTAGTALKILSSRKIQVTTPVKAAGPAAVAAVDDGGTVTKAAGFSFQ